MYICASANSSYLYCYNSSQLAQHLRPSGIIGCWPDGLELSRILSGMQQAAQTVLGIYLKHTCSRNTSASSALGVLCMYDTIQRIRGSVYVRHVCTCVCVCPVSSRLAIDF